MLSRNILKPSLTMLGSAFVLGVTTQTGHTQITNMQARPSYQTASQLPRLPDENVLARLVWSTMVALDNANRTENYTVLYNLGSPQFRQQNSPERLSTLFSNLRENRVDVGRTILSTPNYYRPPEILRDGTLRLRGGFDYRPKSVRFDLIFGNVGGGWRINAISVVEMDAGAPK